MKTSHVLASVLFSTVALAAPLDRRAYATKTEVEIEYYTVYTTVTGAQPAAAATSTPALFYEEKPTTTLQKQPTTVPTTTSSSSSNAAPTTVESEPTTTAVPTVVVPTATEKKPEPTTTSIYTPPPAETTAQAPAPTAAQAAPPSSTSAAAEPSQTSGSGDGQTYTGGSYTMNFYGGGVGACGDPISDTDMAVALAVDTFGEATVDVMTGKTTNPWCGKKIQITNGGKTAIAYVKDRCSGCTMGGLDATPALWEATTGGLGGTSGDRIYSMSWKVVG